MKGRNWKIRYQALDFLTLLLVQPDPRVGPAGNFLAWEGMPRSVYHIFTPESEVDTCSMFVWEFRKPLSGKRLEPGLSS